MTRAGVCLGAALALACTPTPAPPEPKPATPASRPDASISAEPEPEAEPEPTVPEAAATVDVSDLPPVGGQNLVQRGNGKPRHAETPAACRACNGSWGPHGITGAVGCICGTRDAGKRCTSPLDCEAECIVDNPDDYRGVRCGPNGCNGPELVGSCAAWVASFGCHGRIVEMPYDGGVVREVHTICLD